MQQEDKEDGAGLNPLCLNLGPNCPFSSDVSAPAPYEGTEDMLRITCSNPINILRACQSPSQRSSKGVMFLLSRLTGPACQWAKYLTIKHSFLQNLVWFGCMLAFLSLILRRKNHTEIFWWGV